MELFVIHRFTTAFPLPPPPPSPQSPEPEPVEEYISNVKSAFGEFCSCVFRRLTSEQLAVATE